MDMQKIITIQKGDYSAKINLSRGANCIGIRNEKYGATILREPDYSKKLDNPYLYGMPILFPVNRISGGKFEFEERKYEFPVNEPKTGCHLHGMLHEMEFVLLEASDSKVSCLYRATKEEPYLAFPHEFEVRMEYEVKEDGFYHRVEVLNASEENMPVLLGFHTTFLSRFVAENTDGDVRVFADIAEEYERNMENYLPTGNKPVFDATSVSLNQGMFDPLKEPTSRHYRAGQSGKMAIYDATNDLTLVYENDEKYGFRLIYNGNANEYICLEPQNCLANCANSPFSREEAGFDYIEPGKSKEYVSKIYIHKGRI